MSRVLDAMKRLCTEDKRNLKQAVTAFAWKPSVATIRRYCLDGLWSPILGERVYLEFYREGWTYITSVQAIERFCARINGFDEE